MIKKEKILGLLGMIFGINLIRLVSAAYQPSYYVDTGLDFFKNNYGPFFAAIIGTSNFDEFLFAKILTLFLIFSIVFMVLRKSDLFGENRPVVFIVAFIVSILAVRYMSENEFIVGVLLPYGVLGTALMLLLPLLIYGLFVHNSIPGTPARRLAWGLYLIVFGVMMYMRLQKGDISEASKWIYWVGLGFVAANIGFDKEIHKYFGLMSFYKVTAKQKDDLKLEIKRELHEAAEDWKKGLISDSEYNKKSAKLRKKYKSL